MVWPCPLHFSRMSATCARTNDSRLYHNDRRGSWPLIGPPAKRGRTTDGHRLTPSAAPAHVRSPLSENA
ncbi:hypothetical protein EVAR_10019_1 [Eumeta japonica]|uniref:Uncharacterized protein n=1 Tax=Eumeta variegata TaxID=151549 RepID=A0A4C1TR40_EUMVA|nr:hypothetical protein EVAR_10019_1 [Eumeta japonica]